MTSKVLLLALILTACTSGPPELDPIPPDSGWQPTGVNAVNLRLMAAHPADLAHAADDPDALGQEAAPAVERLLTGHPKALPVTDITGIEPAAASSAAPAASGGPPPAGN